MLKTKIVSSTLFKDLYIKHKSKMASNDNSLDNAYEVSMRYFDETRRKVFEIKNNRDCVLYALMYNISSSLNSYIKNIFLDINSNTTALLLRNMIESIVIYEWLFCKKSDKHFIEGFYYHHIFQEKLFMDRYFVIGKGEKINSDFYNKYCKTILLIKNIYAFKNEKYTIKIFSKRMGWSYGLVKKSSYATMSFLVRLIESDQLKHIYFKNKLNDIIHLSNFTLSKDLIRDNTVIDKCLETLKQIENRTNIKIKITSMADLRKGFSISVFERAQHRNVSMTKLLKKDKRYLEETKKIIQKDPLKNEFNFDTRFEFESILYAGGYSQIYVSNMYVFTFIAEVVYQYGTQKQKRLIKYLVPLIEDIQSDYAFGFHNELKLKYRYILEYLILLFLNKSTDSNYETFIQNIFESLYDKTSSVLLGALYQESCNYIHPNVYGYSGYYSIDTEIIVEYIESLEIIVNIFLKKFLESFPLNNKVYTMITNIYFSYLNEYHRVKSIFSKFQIKI